MPHGIDGLVEAAKITAESDDEETKEIAKEILGDDEDPKDLKKSDDDGDDDSAKDDATKDADDDKDPEDDKSKSDDDSGKDDEADKDKDSDKEKEDPEKEKKSDEDPQASKDEPKQTRKEKREERRQSYIESIRKDNASSKAPANIPKYDPINYEAVDENGNPREFNPEELAKDREMVQALGFAKGAEQAAYWNEQKSFWTELDHEERSLGYDPKFSFLIDKLPDGSDNPKFNPDRTEEMNQRFFDLIGYQQSYDLDAQGRAKLGSDGKPIVLHTVKRTDISYEKFVREDLKRLEEYAKEVADDREDEVRDNVTKQRRTQSIRSGGGARKTLGSLEVGDISKMSQEEFEANEDAINAQIAGMK